VPAGPMNLPEISCDQRLAISCFNRRIFILQLPKNSVVLFRVDRRKKFLRSNHRPCRLSLRRGIGRLYPFFCAGPPPCIVISGMFMSIVKLTSPTSTSCPSESRNSIRTLLSPF